WAAASFPPAAYARPAKTTTQIPNATEVVRRRMECILTKLRQRRPMLLRSSGLSVLSGFAPGLTVGGRVVGVVGVAGVGDFRVSGSVLAAGGSGLTAGGAGIGG